MRYVIELMWMPSARAAARRTQRAAARASSVSSSGVSRDSAYLSSGPSTSVTKPRRASGDCTSSSSRNAPSDR
jgi:hypothetical protein